MNYTIYYHVKGQPRKDILKGIAFRVLLDTDGAELEDRNYLVEFLKWMKESGRRVVEITLPQPCTKCSGWTNTRQSIYSPLYKGKK